MFYISHHVKHGIVTTEVVNPSIEVGSDNCGTSQEPDFSINEGKPRMHLNLPCDLQIDFCFRSSLLHGVIRS